MTALIALIGFIVFAARRLLTYLHLFQQEEYDNRRFVAWLWRERGFDRRLSVVLLAVLAVQVLFGNVVLAVAFCRRNRPRLPRRRRRRARSAQDREKAAGDDARAKRIYGIALALCAALGVAAALASDFVVVWIVAVQLVPLTLVGANLLLAPFEARVQRRYWDEAHAEAASGSTRP